MINKFEYVSENLKKINFNINETIAKYRKPNEKVSLMAVTKTVDAEIVNYAISQGINLLGENKVQEYQSKMELYDKSARVHFIGHLQSNKVKYIIDDVDIIQSVDSIKLATEINRLAEKNNKIMDILCEINIGGEYSKSGIAPENAEYFLRQLSEMKNICVKGLMTIPPPAKDEKFLFEMQQLYIDISSKKLDNIYMDILSMGMSNDYMNAIKYGSNLVRIGSSLFGARNYNL